MKKKIAIITTIAVLAVAGVGGTLAYFNAQTEELKNVFVASPGFTDDDDVLIDLKEYFLGEQPTNIYNAETGVPTTISAKYLPNQSFIKKPWVENNSELAAFVAIKISFEVNKDSDPEYETATKAEFDALATLVNLNSDGKWIIENKTNCIVAYYSEKLDAKASTTVDTTGFLFTGVKAKSTLNEDTALPFNVVLKAYAVQADFNDNTTAKTAIDAEYSSQLN